jgi:hypothetical protein
LLQDPKKITQIGIFGLKIYHLATLARIRVVLCAPYPNIARCSEKKNRQKMTN